jgi:hypothetical protein
MTMSGSFSGRLLKNPSPVAKEAAKGSRVICGGKAHAFATLEAGKARNVSSSANP